MFTKSNLVSYSRSLFAYGDPDEFERVSWAACKLIKHSYWQWEYAPFFRSFIHNDEYLTTKKLALPDALGTGKLIMSILFWREYGSGFLRPDTGKMPQSVIILLKRTRIARFTQASRNSFSLFRSGFANSNEWLFCFLAAYLLTSFFCIIRCCKSILSWSGQHILFLLSRD